MKVLVLSNMYPSVEKPYAGIFVQNQFKALLEILGEDQIEIRFMRRTMTGVIGSAVKYFVFFIKLIPVFFKRYDVIHFHYFFLAVLLMPYKLFYPKCKFALTFHGQDIVRQIPGKGFKNRFWCKALSCVDASLPVGKKIAVEVEKKLKIPTKDIIPVGVNEKVFYPQNLEKRYDFCFVGSFYDVKGVDIIVDALKDLNRTDIRFCFCGSGPYLPLLESLKKSLNIDILGSKDHASLSQLYNSSRFLLCHSRSEGFPTVTMEAMYCGVPVIVSDIPQYLEQVNNGVNGWVLPLGDNNAIKNKVIELHSMDEASYEVYSKNAAASLKEFSLRQVAHKLSYLYQQLILGR